MKEWISVTEAARIAGCSTTTVYSRIKAAGGVGARYRRRANGRGKARMVTREWAESLVVGGGDTSDLQAQIDQAIVSRDKWRADHTRQANEIGALKARIERQKKEIESLKLEIQTYADTYAEGRPPAVIDRLVAAVDADPLRATTEIDAPRHAALRRVVGLWTAVQHAVMQFQPGDSAQTNNDDEEVT
jgi:hypothetical protein